MKGYSGQSNIPLYDFKIDLFRVFKNINGEERARGESFAVLGNQVQFCCNVSQHAITRKKKKIKKLCHVDKGNNRGCIVGERRPCYSALLLHGQDVFLRQISKKTN